MRVRISLLSTVPFFVLACAVAFDAQGAQGPPSTWQHTVDAGHVQALASWSARGNRDGERPQSRPERPRNPPPRRPERSAPRAPSYTHGRSYYWHGAPSYWRGRVYWNLDIHRFPREGYAAWRAGHWRHGWYGDRWGWWWVVGGIWYYYVAPIYPYPSPYVPGTVIVESPEPPPAPPTQPAPQYWYHCSAPEGYYPYVPECPGGWHRVAATPPPATEPPAPGTPPRR